MLTKRPSRHAKIMRGVVTPIFGLLAVAAVVLGYMNATMWKPSTEITASATMSGSRYVVTDPNVLTLMERAEHPEGKQHESGSAYQCR